MSDVDKPTGSFDGSDRSFRGSTTGSFHESLGDLPVEQAVELDRVCNEFEAAWGAGRPRSVEVALMGVVESLRPAAVRELVALDAFYRRKAGGSPRAEDYSARFPDLDLDWLAGVVAGSGPRFEKTPPVCHAIGLAADTVIARKDYPRANVPPGSSVERFRVVLVSESGTSEPRDLTDQLRKRLRLFAFLAAGSAFIDVAIKLMFHGSEILSTAGPWTHRQQSIVMLTILTLIESLAILQLEVRQNQTLRHLRLLEALVFAGIILFFIENDIGGLRQDRDIIPRLWTVYSNAAALPYALLIVSYGVLIPNPWRRCTAAVGLFAICAYLSSSVGFALAPQPVGIITTYFAQLTIWLGVAGVIVIYGAYRIEILRDQAALGRELGQYRLRQLLGSGGMGEVYLAAHRLLRRPCAIKLIRPERAGDPQNLNRFELEVQATATLTHPNTIQIYDYGHTNDGTFYYVMEYLNGLTLEEMVKLHGAIPPARVVHLLRQVCNALSEAHAIGLIHRDIKPGNVMVCQRGGIADVVKLLDCGLVLPLANTGDGERLTQNGTISGTPAYMSPEQADACENLDPRSDIYSLGALAYFALTGNSPFAGRSSVKMLWAHLYEQPEPLVRHCPEMAEDLERIVLRCLAKDPAERFPNVESLETALSECQCSDRWSRKEATAWWHSHVALNGMTVTKK